MEEEIKIIKEIEINNLDQKLFLNNIYITLTMLCKCDIIKVI